MKKLILLPILVIGLLAVSCKKEGCTDANAENYSEKAKKDNGSCIYEGQAVIWWDQQTAINLINYQSYTLYIYLDNILVATKSTSTYWTAAPGCGASESVTVKRDMKSNPTESVSYYIKDEYDEVLWSGTILFEGGECKTKQVIY